MATKDTNAMGGSKRRLTRRSYKCTAYIECELECKKIISYTLVELIYGLFVSYKLFRTGVPALIRLTNNTKSSSLI